jgi:hypothetical protein
MVAEVCLGKVGAVAVVNRLDLRPTERYKAIPHRVL